MAPPAPITSFRHPQYNFNLPDWQLWRYIWEGGDAFTTAYLRKFSKRESEEDFRRRKEITPVPGFAKAALVDIKNAVFHRMGDIVRRDGSKSYMSAVEGYGGGVDRKGGSMNHFIGTKCLPEMLSMGQCGVYVDNIAPAGPTMADAQEASPYLYMYRVEDMLSWEGSLPEQKSEFQAVLLRDWVVSYQSAFQGIRLPQSHFQRFRLVWIDPETGRVNYQFFNEADEPITANGEPGGVPVELELTRIPFVTLDIGDSLLRDIAGHQIALLNLVSSDIAYALKANVPMYLEQQDSRAAGSHLKTDVMEDGTASSGGQASGDNTMKHGSIDGRIYDVGVDAPSYIAPPSEPLLASMKLQQKLEDDIRKLVNLAVVALGTSRASAEARGIDNQGLEAGLAFIGMVLENAERKIADHWSAYEGNDKRDTVVVKYPEQYSLKTNVERIEEADKLTSLMFSIPSTTAKKELAKDATQALMGGRVKPDKIQKIFTEIDAAKYSTSDPEVIRLAKEEGLAGDITLSNALGFDGESEIPKAEKDHAKRIARIAEAQSNTEPNPDRPGARGMKDMSADPKEGQSEREEVNDTDTSDSTKPPTRGRGKAVK